MPLAQLAPLTQRVCSCRRLLARAAVPAGVKTKLLDARALCSEMRGAGSARAHWFREMQVGKATAFSVFSPSLVFLLKTFASSLRARTGGRRACQRLARGACWGEACPGK